MRINVIDLVCKRVAHAANVAGMNQLRLYVVQSRNEQTCSDHLSGYNGV